MDRAAGGAARSNGMRYVTISNSFEFFRNTKRDHLIAEGRVKAGEPHCAWQKWRFVTKQKSSCAAEPSPCSALASRIAFQQSDVVPFFSSGDAGTVRGKGL